MEELSGRVQKASTYVGSVGVDIAIVERHCASVDANATSILPNNGGTSVKASIPSGRWGGFMCRKPSTYTLRAHKGATHSMSVKASTPSGRWGGYGGVFGGVLQNARQTPCLSRSGSTGGSRCQRRCRRHLHLRTATSRGK